MLIFILIKKVQQADQPMRLKDGSAAYDEPRRDLPRGYASYDGRGHAPAGAKKL